MLSERFTTCAKCGKKPPDVTSFTIGDEVLCSLCAPSRKWGICNRCGKPANCERYAIEIGRANKDVDVCEPCFFELKDLTEKWFNQPGQERAARKADDEKAYLDYLARTGGKSSCPSNDA